MEQIPAKNITDLIISPSSMFFYIYYFFTHADSKHPPQLCSGCIGWFSGKCLGTSFVIKEDIIYFISKASNAAIEYSFDVKFSCVADLILMLISKQPFFFLM